MAAVHLRTAPVLPRRPTTDVKIQAPARSEFSNILQSLTAEMDRGEAAVHAVTRSGAPNVSTNDLLALQARVYRYSEAIDLAAKLVDRATNGVKTLLTGQ